LSAAAFQLKWFLGQDFRCPARRKLRQALAVTGIISPASDLKMEGRMENLQPIFFIFFS